VTFPLMAKIRDGETVRRFAPTDTPESFEKDIVSLL
jgi:glutathione peroxidase-family protein